MQTANDQYTTISVAENYSAGPVGTIVTVNNAGTPGILNRDGYCVNHAYDVAYVCLPQESRHRIVRDFRLKQTRAENHFSYRRFGRGRTSSPSMWYQVIVETARSSSGPAAYTATANAFSCLTVLVSLVCLVSNSSSDRAEVQSITHVRLGRYGMPRSTGAGWWR